MRRKKLKLIALVILLVLFAWKTCTPPAEVASTEHLIGRPWLERLPENPREQIDHLMFVERGHTGVFGKSSLYRMQFDFIRWKLEGDRLNVELLQDEKRKSYRVKTWACPKEAPRGLDLCLELAEDGGSKRRFFSKKNWDRDDLPAWATALDTAPK
jgi:hypothetical protein